MTSAEYVLAIRRRIEEQADGLAHRLAGLCDEDLEDLCRVMRTARHSPFGVERSPDNVSGYTSMLARASLISELMDLAYYPLQLREGGGARQVIPQPGY